MWIETEGLGYAVDSETAEYLEQLEVGRQALETAMGDAEAIGLKEVIDRADAVSELGRPALAGAVLMMVDKQQLHWLDTGNLGRGPKPSTRLS